MRVLIFGASGMIGQGVLRECLLDSGVDGILSIGRSKSGQSDPRLREIVHADLFHYESLEPELSGFDACFFSLGMTSVGKTETEYTRITYDLTLAAATTLAGLNPQMTFIYVSGAGTDSTEAGRYMWARVKGRTENAILRLPFKAAYMFRPFLIQPLHGIRSKTPVYQRVYDVTRPALPFLLRVFPQYVTTTERLGRAMLKAARDGAPKRILESVDINRLS
jgi:uncharacterized protein YbjT (DUF2867 family)